MALLSVVGQMGRDAVWRGHVSHGSTLQKIGAAAYFTSYRAANRLQV